MSVRLALPASASSSSRPISDLILFLSVHRRREHYRCAHGTTDGGCPQGHRPADPRGCRSVHRYALFFSLSVGCPLFFAAVTLCTQHRTLLRGHTKRVLKALSYAITDPSAVVSKSMCAAAAAVCVCAKEQQVEEYIDTLTKMYTEVRIPVYLSFRVCISRGYSVCDSARYSYVM